MKAVLQAMWSSARPLLFHSRVVFWLALLIGAIITPTDPRGRHTLVRPIAVAAVYYASLIEHRRKEPLV